jgi:2-(1,2-epoxy-1,2-dihydrophenyl)acetyl-CoA isomerase
MNDPTPPPFESLSVTLAEGVATLRLDRPDALNAFDRQLGEELLRALRQVAADDAVRAVVLTGEGRAFSSGADLASVREGDVRTPSGAPDLQRILTERFNPAIVCIREMPKPVIAAVAGPAVGVGVSLALACDVVMAAESAYFMLAFARIGLVPDGAASLLVPSRVGFTRAARMALLAEAIPAAQAVDWGLIDSVDPDALFADRVTALAARFAAGPTLAYAGVKRQLNEHLFAGIGKQMELEASIQQELVGSHDFHEGLAAFAEKRPPRFTGR